MREYLVENGDTRSWSSDPANASSCTSFRDILVMDKPGHYHWTLKLVMKMSYVPRFCVIRIQALVPPPEDVHGPKPCTSSAFGPRPTYSLHPEGCIADGDFSVRYGEPLEPGDLVGFHVDTVRHTIEFSRNGRALGVAYRDVATQLKFSTSGLMELQPPGFTFVPEDLEGKCYRLLLRNRSHDELLQCLPPGMKIHLSRFEFLSRFSRRPFKKKRAIECLTVLPRHMYATFSLRPDRQPPRALVRSLEAQGVPIFRRPLRTSWGESTSPTKKSTRVKSNRKCPCCGKDEWCK